MVDLHEGRGPKTNSRASATTWGGMALLAARLPAEMLNAGPVIEEGLFYAGLAAVFAGVAWQKRSERRSKR